MKAKEEIIEDKGEEEAMLIEDKVEGVEENKQEHDK